MSPTCAGYLVGRSLGRPTVVGSKAALVVARSAVFELVESLLLTYESCLWLCKRRRVVELQGFVESLLAVVG